MSKEAATPGQEGKRPLLLAQSCGWCGICGKQYKTGDEILDLGDGDMVHARHEQEDEYGRPIFEEAR